jgi:hypothetical protein
VVVRVSFDSDTNFMNLITARFWFFCHLQSTLLNPNQISKKSIYAPPATKYIKF